MLLLLLFTLKKSVCSRDFFSHLFQAVLFSFHFYLIGPFFLIFKKNYIFLNWRVIALQNFVVLCQISTWISHRWIYVPSLLNLSSPQRVSSSAFNNFNTCLFISQVLIFLYLWSELVKKKKPIIENQWRYEHLYEMMGTRRKKWSFTEVGYLGVSNIWILVWCIKPLGVSLT